MPDKERVSLKVRKGQRFSDIGPKKYHYTIKAIARSFGYMPGLDTDDLVQEAYIKLMTAMRDFDPTMDEKTYVITVVKNHFIDILRRSIRNRNRQEDKALYDLPLDGELSNWLESKRAMVDETPEERLVNKEVWDTLVKEIKSKLSAFERLVFDCKVMPDKITDGKMTLSKRAQIEHYRRQVAKRGGMLISDRGIIITDSTIAKHLTALFGDDVDEPISRSEVSTAFARIKEVASEILNYR